MERNTNTGRRKRVVDGFYGGRALGVGSAGKVFRKQLVGRDFVHMGVAKELDGYSEDYLVTQTTRPGTSPSLQFYATIHPRTESCTSP